MAEGALRTGLMSSRGSLLPLIQRPLPLVLLLAAAAMVVWVVWRSRSHAATEG
jgi:TctA family transporter